jgi:hypothetical protein
MAQNPGSRPSGQYVTYNGTRVQLQQGYGLSPQQRPGWVPVKFNGRPMYASTGDFVAPHGMGIAKALAKRI